MFLCRIVSFESRDIKHLNFRKIKEKFPKELCVIRNWQFTFEAREGYSEFLFCIQSHGYFNINLERRQNNERSWTFEKLQNFLVAFKVLHSKRFSQN